MERFLIVAVLLLGVHAGEESREDVLGRNETHSRRKLKCAWSTFKHTTVCTSDETHASHNSGEQNQPSVPHGEASLESMLEALSRRSPRPTGLPAHGNRTKPPPKTVALLYHGHYDRRGTRFGRECSDFFQDASNHQDLLIKPIQAAGSKVLVFFHTYRSSCRDKDAALVGYLKPDKFEFSESLLPRIIDSYIRVTKLALSSNARFYIVSRFDVQYTWPITAIGMDWSKTNIAWRDSESTWMDTRMKKVSDLFVAFSGAHALAFLGALGASANVAKDNHHGPLSSPLVIPAHFIYISMSNQVGAKNIRFIDSAFRVSTVDAKYLKGHPQEGVFLAIDRSCWGKDMDASSKSGGSCWRGLRGQV